MEDSILIATKKILGLSNDYTVFDLDVMTHINAAFGTLNQLGFDPVVISGVDEKWSDLTVEEHVLSQIKTYIYLKVRSIFDPPATSFHLEAMKNQILELEWRLNVFREEALDDT